MATRALPGWERQNGSSGRSEGCRRLPWTLHVTDDSANYHDVGIRLHAILMMASSCSSCDPFAVSYELQMIKGRTRGHTLLLIGTKNNFRFSFAVRLTYTRVLVFSVPIEIRSYVHKQLVQCGSQFAFTCKGVW